MGNRYRLKLRANGRNNSQHCWPKNVGSCCVRLHVAKGIRCIHHYTSLHITTHHYALLRITTHHCASLRITIHHYTSLYYMVCILGVPKVDSSNFMHYKLYFYMKFLKRCLLLYRVLAFRSSVTGMAPLFCEYVHTFSVTFGCK